MTKRRTDLKPGMEVFDPPYTIILLREATPRGNWWVKSKYSESTPAVEFQQSREHINAERARKRLELKNALKRTDR